MGFYMLLICKGILKDMPLLFNFKFFENLIHIYNEI